jgi:hypothetical protein
MSSWYLRLARQAPAGGGLRRNLPRSLPDPNITPADSVAKLKRGFS